MQIKDELENTLREQLDTALENSDKIYDDQITANTKLQKDMISEVKNVGVQKELQQQQDYEYAVRDINKKKQEAEDAKNKEVAASRSDYEKFVDPYGTSAESMASAGLTGSGVAESIKSQAFIQHQQRVAAAQQMHASAVQQYNDAMLEARRLNNAALAQIASDTFDKSFEITMSFLERNNALLEEKEISRSTISKNYYDSFSKVLEAIEGITPENDVVGDAPIAIEGGKLNERRWAAVKGEDGGGNIGIDRNAVVKDEYGNEFELGELFKKLIEDGMDRKDARKYVTNLQRSLRLVNKTFDIDDNSLINLGIKGTPVEELVNLVEQKILGEYTTSEGKLAFEVIDTEKFNEWKKKRK